MAKNKERLTYTLDAKSAYKNADVIFVGVGTPEKKDGSANLKYVYEVCREIAESIEQNTIIVIKSTVPIGTNKKVEKYIKDHLKYDVKVEIVSNPEFLSQGTAVKDTLHAQRIVIGVTSKHAENIMKEVYDGFNILYVITDRESAEMIKYASNDFLALKISYINEIANLCELIGANIEDVTKGMGMDSRIGNKFLNAGIGYGGSCFPKDTKALHWLSNYYDYEIKTIKAAIEVNSNQKIKLIKKARKYYDSFEAMLCRTPEELPLQLIDMPEVPAVDEDHPLQETVVEFTVEEDGVYYYAFHVYSPAFHEILYLSNIRVEEKDNGSAIDTLVSGSSVAVLPGKGCIRIANPKGETVGIYSLNGVKLMEADESMMNAEVPAGVYLVRTQDEVRKVLVY